MAIKDLPSELKPREKAILRGLDSLSDEELLAIVIQVGRRGEDAVELSRKLIVDSNGLYNLAKANYTDIVEKGIGKAKKLKIMASFELGRRANDSYYRKNTVKDIFQAASFGKTIACDGEESLILVCLDKGMNLIKWEKISSYDNSKVVMDYKQILKRAVNFNASYAYLIHNHPSGFINPSKEDIYSTKALIEHFKNVGILLIDHLIVSNDRFFSLHDNREYPLA